MQTSKLTHSQRQEIKALYKGGVSQVQLSQDYNVSRATIQNTIRGYYKTKPKKPKHWGDLSQEDWNYWAKETYLRISRRFA